MLSSHCNLVIALGSFLALSSYGLPIEPQGATNSPVSEDSGNQVPVNLPLDDSEDTAPIVNNNNNIAQLAEPSDVGQGNALPSDDKNVPVETMAQLPSYTALYSMTDVDLTPQAVAEYLLLSGDFVGFDDALTDLVRANILSAEEVWRYKRVVGWEYEKLLREMLEAEAKYLQMFARPLLENLLLGDIDNENAITEDVVSEDSADDKQGNQVEQQLNQQQDTMERPKEQSEMGDNVLKSNADVENLLKALSKQTGSGPPKDDLASELNDLQQNSGTEN